MTMYPLEVLPGHMVSIAFMKSEGEGEEVSFVNDVSVSFAGFSDFSYQQGRIWLPIESLVSLLSGMETNEPETLPELADLIVGEEVWTDRMLYLLSR